MENKELLKRYNFPKLVKKSIQELQGIASAIIYDGKIDQLEIDMLNKWILSNDEYLVEYPLNDLKKLFNEIMEDGIASIEERQKLLTFLESISSNYEGDVIVNNIFDEESKINFSDQKFVFTGDLQFGSRSLAKEHVLKRGGYCVSDVSKLTNYLIVGSLGSENYQFGRFGLKIQKAIDLRKDPNSNIKIIAESNFVKCIVEE